jgi:hypothetical protein
MSSCKYFMHIQDFVLFLLIIVLACWNHVTRLTWWMPLVEQELFTLLEHVSSPPVFSGVRVIQSLVLYVCFVDRLLSFFFWPLCCPFFFDLGFWWPLWYLQTPLVYIILIQSHPVSYSLMLHAEQRSNKYQFYSLWFDLWPDLRL